MIGSRGVAIVPRPLHDLDALEVHSGVVVGGRCTPPPVVARPAAPPREVLDEILVDALSEPPCHVLFSGGRDSSVILAAATEAARRHGLEAPIPLTARYARYPRAQETEWQERVVRHLGLADWVTFEVTTELDALGPIATRMLREHGSFWPPNAFSMVLFAQRARNRGTLLTGSGGDELFTPWVGRRLPPRALRRVRPLRRAVRVAAKQALPRRLRHAHRVRRASAGIPWLTPVAAAELQRRWRAGARYEPTWPHAVMGLLESRYYELVRSVLDRFAADAGVRLVEPLYDPRMVAAFAASGPRSGYPDRGLALEAHFGDLLPREVLHRSTKATFNEVAAGPGMRAFAEGWSGDGLDQELVVADALRDVWLRPAPDVRSLSALHRAWLAAH